ncbi:hypothetical protein DIURU_000985 [Diutina rugosa]|uniref:RRM domain-containing protein n=1 Tax=Diutina rugosa TaxID=5481 RepID=A0A642UVM3_DIURU|nr:uncharacterized protein DIURU_000985 [Diutina rugosa]KAA8906576.1 hypothetical protein DIURU_000985 [Diutina rugosa]
MSYYDPYHPSYMAQPYFGYMDEGEYLAPEPPAPFDQRPAVGYAGYDSYGGYDKYALDADPGAPTPSYPVPQQPAMAVTHNLPAMGPAQPQHHHKPHTRRPSYPRQQQQPQSYANTYGSYPQARQHQPHQGHQGPSQSPSDVSTRTSSASPPGHAAPSRTVYLGNIPGDIPPNELLDYVRSGILESVKILPQKNCAFISFVDPQSALLFHSDCILKKLSIKGHDIRVGWGKNQQMLPAVLEAIQRDGATRNVYLGNLTNPHTGEMITEDELRADLSCFGVIDCIKIIPEKGIAFIHFLSILSAIRCVANLPLKDKYLDKKCFYGKDRCAFITKTQQHNAAQYLGLAPGMEHIVTAADREYISSALVQQQAAAAQIATQAGGASNLGNRTVYLGNLHQDSSVEEICNVVRGGLLQSIRFLKERHVCFITFVDPIAAAQFYAMCQLHGLTIHNRRIKVGWGKHSGPLSNALSLAVSNGASRNIYIGNIQDFNHFNSQKLRDDFAMFGDIEQINYLEEKNCAFINFVNIANAIKAIDGIKSFPDYKNLKINFGKDRCGNLPRQFQSQAAAGASAVGGAQVSTMVGALNGAADPSGDNAANFGVGNAALCGNADRL